MKAVADTPVANSIGTRPSGMCLIVIRRPGQGNVVHATRLNESPPGLGIR
jgi:hypothetical protein